jgi:mRNA interferase MazF
MAGPSQAWDIVRMDFPYADSNTGTVRPALVVATPAATGTFNIVWVLMITSARHSPWPGDVAVSDLPAAGLSHPSIVRTAKIAAIDSRLAETIGRLSEADRAAVSQHLRQQFGQALEQHQPD